MDNKPWICRESLFYRNTDPGIGTHVWQFKTESEAKAQFESRKRVYSLNLSPIDEDDNDWVEIDVKSKHLCIFYNQCAGGNIVINYYCQGYNGTKETLPKE